MGEARLVQLTTNRWMREESRMKRTSTTSNNLLDNHARATVSID
jgi:hypothetical protein